MKQLLRFSISGTLGIIITLALFIGMLSLLSGSQPSRVTTDADFNFAFVKDYKAPQEKPPKTHEKPKLKPVEQPPAAPKLNVESHKNTTIKIPMAGTKGNELNILKGIGMPGIGGMGQFSADNPGVVKAAIAPIYPQSALLSKTEGWVQVQISVTEFGTVSAVEVLDAEPARVFNTAAKQAVKKWRFHPKMIDGKAVPFVAAQTIEFKIEG